VPACYAVRHHLGGKAFDCVPDNRTKNRWASWKRVKGQVPSDLTPDMLPRISKMGNLFLHFRKVPDFIGEKMKEMGQHLWKEVGISSFLLLNRWKPFVPS